MFLVYNGFIRVCNVWRIKKIFMDINTLQFGCSNMWPLDLFNELSQIHYIKPDGTVYECAKGYTASWNARKLYRSKQKCIYTNDSIAWVCQRATKLNRFCYLLYILKRSHIPQPTTMYFPILYARSEGPGQTVSCSGYWD